MTNSQIHEIDAQIGGDWLDLRPILVLFQRGKLFSIQPQPGQIIGLDIVPVDLVNSVQGELSFYLLFYYFLLLLFRLTFCLVTLAIVLGLSDLLLVVSGCVSKIPKLKLDLLFSKLSKTH